MGITYSSPGIIDEFDGEAGDHNLSPDDISYDISSEWLVVSPYNFEILKEQLEELDNIPEKVELFNFNGQLIAGKCVKVYDGDTCHFVVKYNGKWVKRRFRMLGYNSPEIVIKKTSNLSDKEKDEEKRRGIAARDYLASRILDKKVVLRLDNFDKYGRVLCDVYLIENPTLDCSDRVFKKHVNTEMIEMGYGRIYMPKTRKLSRDNTKRTVKLP